MSVKNRYVSLPTAALISVLLLVATLSAQSKPDVHRSGQWRIAGQNLNNTWRQPAEHSISPANVKGLKPKGVFTTGGDDSATPTVDCVADYFLDWVGNRFSAGRNSVSLMWYLLISDHDGCA